MTTSPAAHRGPGRPPTGERVEVRIPAEVLKQIDAIAEDWKTTRAHITRLVITLGLQEWAEADERARPR